MKPQKMTQFKPGDRVIAFGQPECGTFSAPSIEGDAGVVVEFSDSGFIRIRLDVQYSDDGIFAFHPKQVRKLKPKAKPREFEINRDSALGVLGVINFGNSEVRPGERIRVREVLEKGKR